MMRKWIFFWLFVLLLLGGCSSNEKKEKQIDANKDITTNETNRVEDNVEKEPVVDAKLEFDEESKIIENLTIPTTEKELLQQIGGIFTKDVPYEEETKQRWGNFGLGAYEGELTEKLRQVTKITQDSTVIFQALQYYIGSHAYERTITELKGFTVDWYEPYLPEPSEMEEKQNFVDPGKALILLDASSSMLLNVEGKQKMSVAKIAATRFANTIGNTHDVSLIVYGHAGTQNNEDKQLSCTTIDEVYPLQSFDPEKFTQAIEGVQARGWTPIANAIKAAREKMTDSKDNVTLYIISDGAETCGGNPVAEAKAFAKEDANRSVNIIGFNVDQAGENSLKEIAAAGNGEYISAKTIDDLNNSIKKTWVPSFMEVASKSNSLLKQWEQSFDEMKDRTRLADKIYYASINEKSRFYSALNIMSAEKMITPETSKKLTELIENKANLVLNVRNKLDKQKMDENETNRQQIIERVNEWSNRMNKLRENQK
ncbi:VWA domain-containing protein [Lysinibacillus sp. BPa_S21]|uniref:vWA domain-containing protein n=1 Tax=Lysinibacillus sp. BPa_S21 TaxID=2932478 RepID=UPI0020113CEF|nr:VWA domain-containing protein [Lysinibacillus sp. BPa_S21]MCL1694821.1 VWA domain-containing protein [Lysinibacillus sp. BPa_S21]